MNTTLARYAPHFLLVLFVMILFSCNEDEGASDTLLLSRNDISFESDGGQTTLLLETSASEWKILNPTDWIFLSETNGTTSSASITLEVNGKSAEERSGILTVVAGDASEEVSVSQAASEYLYSLSSNYATLTCQKGGSSITVDVTSDAPEWTITSEADWLTFDPATGSENGSVKITALENPNAEGREATVSISGDLTPSVEMSAIQNGELYPSYNTDPLPPDETGMTSTAVELAATMTLGWNAGNSLEAIGGETAWGNPQITGQLIDLVKESGFNAIRLPCSWNQYMENPSAAELDESWLNRVKEVVQYCVDRDMYVILNIHWDGGWLENNCTPARQEENNAKQKAFWEQIATHLRDFDEHLLFASANEPNVDNATQMAVLNSYHQTFVDAVRSTGGKNSYRVLVVQGPYTDIERTNELMNTLPQDEVEDKMMAEVHYYTPWNFCGLTQDEDWGTMFYYWGEGNHSTTDTERNSTWGEEAFVREAFGMMETQFVQKGIPVILGEYSALRRTNLTGDVLQAHLNSRAYFHEYVTRQALAHGLIPFYWDNGAYTMASGIFDRAGLSVMDQQTLDALNNAKD